MKRSWLLRVLAAAAALVALVEPAAAQLLSAQDDSTEELPEMETDRETFTPSTTTTGKDLWIAEWSYTYIDNRDDPDTNSWPELLVRYGISERVELRLGWNYEVGGGGNVVSALESAEGLDNGELSSESRIIYGFKAQVTEQRGWTPRSVVILEGFTPTSGENPASQPVATYAGGWLLPNDWRWDSAIRYSQGFDLGDAYNRFAPSTVLRIPAGPNFQYHLGAFGSFTEGRSIDRNRVFISPGCHYNFTPNLELGLRVGWGLTDDSANFFVNTGFGWRF
jgi:hypothetical protein